MKSYAIVEKGSHLIQQNEDRILCVFSTRKDAESHLKIAGGERTSELCIVECEVKRWRKT